MLFLKRASDLFDQRRAEIRKESTAKGMTEEDILIELEDTDNCSRKYFYVPPRARWNDVREEEVVETDKDGNVCPPLMKMSLWTSDGLGPSPFVQHVNRSVKPDELERVADMG